MMTYGGCAMGNGYPIRGIGRRLLLGASALAGSSMLIGRPAQAQPDQAAFAELIKDWPREAKAAAEDMLRRYGTPQEASATQLHWQANRPWVRTIVYKAGVEHDFPAKHTDVLEQVVS
ncbi:MAG TPA: hypothetical protein VIL69_20190, partial [Roseomonas sp.]